MIYSHVGSDPNGEDMTFTVTPRNVGTTTERGPARVSSTDFGCNFEVVELASDSDSESVAEVGGPGLGFNANRNSLIPPPRFLALDLRERLSSEEMARGAAATKARWASIRAGKKDPKAKR